MTYIDYYEILGISKTASDKEVKQAYRKLARQHHPDLHQGDAKAKAEEKFKLINEAYEVLGDPEKRSKYDQLGMNWQADDNIHFDPTNPAGNQTYTYQGSADFDGNHFGFSDFFSNIFGQDFARSEYSGGQARSANYKGEDVDANISLTVNELIHGIEKELYLSLPNVCTTCQGQRFSQRGICPSCGGTGVIEDTRTVKVKIPAGLYPGATLRLKGLGGKGYGTGSAGDLHLHLQVTENASWQVTGSDLETELILYPEQAVLGDNIKVSTPHGAVQLKIQPGTHAGQRLRLKNKGLPKKQGLGDLYFKICIDIPQNLSITAKELYQQLHKLNTTDREMPETKIA